MDQHTLSNYADVCTKHLKLRLDINFDSSIITGTATHLIENNSEASEFILDTNGLHITSVWVDDIEQEYTIGQTVKHLGNSLSIPISSKSEQVEIHYQTTGESAGLQWLQTNQTQGKKLPMLFSQSQAILARTWIPCQDTPSIKHTWEASAINNLGLNILMSAKKLETSIDEVASRFEMQHPVPSYLISLCCGNLVHASVSEQCGIYAEPELIEKAKSEFSAIDKMLKSAEALYGDYRWDTFDVLVLPPSFPFGGMENPMVTFLTPTLIAGDQSLTNVVAHELAHSWSGNMVTCATWNDFWLNEGFTVYFERRLIEQLEGKEAAELHSYLAYEELLEELEQLKSKPKDTQLLLDLKDRDPDDGMTLIAYEKGYFLLKTIEALIGRIALDQFIVEYFRHFAFKSLNTREFVTFIKSKMPKEQLEAITTILDEWIYKPGLPASFPKPISKLNEDVKSKIVAFTKGDLPSHYDVKNWNWLQTILFLNGITEKASIEDMPTLQSIFNLSKTENAEIEFAWLRLVVLFQFKQAYPQLEAFLIKVGRRKFVEPLFKLLTKTEKGKRLAKSIFRKAKNGYHSITRKTIEQILT